MYLTGMKPHILVELSKTKFWKGTHMTFTSEQFANAVGEWIDQEDEAGTLDDWGSFGERVLSEEPFNLEGIGTIKYVTYEQHNDDIWAIFTVDDDPQLYKLSGYYSSYDADEWYDDRIIPVKAEEKTIIIYTAI